MAKEILLVSHDFDLNEAIQTSLNKDQFHISVVSSVLTGADALEKQKFHLAIIDATDEEFVSSRLHNLLKANDDHHLTSSILFTSEEQEMNTDDLPATKAVLSKPFDKQAFTKAVYASIGAQPVQKILVIDDDLGDRSLIQQYITKANFEGIFVQAETGEEGLELFETQSPDLVVLDVMLPGMSGFDVCKEMKEKNATVKVIMLTGFSDGFHDDKRQEAGADLYITKEFMEASLQKAFLRIQGL